VALLLIGAGADVNPRNRTVKSALQEVPLSLTLLISLSLLSLSSPLIPFSKFSLNPQSYG
jgi:hypothetical protein